MNVTPWHRDRNHRHSLARQLDAPGVGAASTWLADLVGDILFVSRFHQQLDRLEREKKALEERRAKAKKALNKPKAGDVDDKKAEIAAALERVKAKKAQQDANAKNIDGLSAEQQAKISEIDKRRAAQNTTTGE